MLHTLLIAAGLAALPAVSAAADHSPGYVKYAVAARSFSPGVLQKRQSEVGLAQQQSGLSYTITLMIGTPGQKVTVQIDTGSSHLWVNPDCDNSQLSPLSIPFCHSLGRFDPTQSSTNRNLSQLFVAGYVGVNASLSLVTDDISVGCTSPTSGSMHTFSCLELAKLTMQLDSDYSQGPTVWGGIPKLPRALWHSWPWCQRIF